MKIGNQKKNVKEQTSIAIKTFHGISIINEKQFNSISK